MASNSMESLDNHMIQQMIRNSMALQQTLSAITATREHQLDHARKYYEMLYMEPEEIIKEIIEKGPKYTELQVSLILDYLNNIFLKIIFSFLVSSSI